MSTVSSRSRAGVGALAVAAVSALGVVFAGPGAAQDSISCVRTVTEDGAVGVEVYQGPPPCPDGFVEADDNTSVSTPTTATTMADTSDDAAADETTTTVAEGDDATAPESPVADAVEAEPDYTG